MNNEPVAWINTDFDSVSTTPNIRSWLSYKKEGTASQPLYTHPAKTLTDEEITAISKEIFKDYKNFHHYQIDFARAILRKAQEK
jgi:hypothetical protein